MCRPRGWKKGGQTGRSVACGSTEHTHSLLCSHARCFMRMCTVGAVRRSVRMRPAASAVQAKRMEDAEKAGMTMEQWYAAEPEKDRLYERFMCAPLPGPPLPIEACKDLGTPAVLAMAAVSAPTACPSGVREAVMGTRGAVCCVAVGRLRNALCGLFFYAPHSVSLLCTLALVRVRARREGAKVWVCSCARAHSAAQGNRSTLHELEGHACCVVLSCGVPFWHLRLTKHHHQPIGGCAGTAFQRGHENPKLTCLRSCSNVEGVKGQTANALHRTCLWESLEDTILQIYQGSVKVKQRMRPAGQNVTGTLR